MEFIKISIHHIEYFVRALVLEDFRERVYLRAGEGFCYSEEQVEPLRNLLASVSDNTRAQIVRGKDAICSLCPKNSETACLSLDDEDDCEILDRIEPNMTVTIQFLKEKFLKS